MILLLALAPLVAVTAAYVGSAYWRRFHGADEWTTTPWWVHATTRLDEWQRDIWRRLSEPL